MIIRPRRSALYMPGSNARALEKAKTLAADAVILDLEDAVAPDAKTMARQQVVAAIKGGGYGQRELVVRINSLTSAWGHEDLAAVATCGADAVLIPKVSTPGEIMLAARQLTQAGAPETTKLWAMIETPQAILNLDSIARTARDPSSRLAVFVMGTNDLAKETRARLVAGRAPMQAWLSLSVAAARANSIEILDGVWNDLADEAGFRAECEQGRDFGMDGKTLIHPGQVALANAIFAPAAEELAWAAKIIAAFEVPENAGKGAISLDGRMVERLHADIAQRTLALGSAIAAMG